MKGETSKTRKLIAGELDEVTGGTVLWPAVIVAIYDAAVDKLIDNLAVSEDW